jgi:hypothetical protein
MDRREAELERAAANAHEIALRLASSNQARRIAPNFARLPGLLSVADRQQPIAPRFLRPARRRGRPLGRHGGHSLVESRGARDPYLWRAGKHGVCGHPFRERGRGARGIRRSSSRPREGDRHQGGPTYVAFKRESLGALLSPLPHAVHTRARPETFFSAPTPLSHPVAPARSNPPLPAPRATSRARAKGQSRHFAFSSLLKSLRLGASPAPRALGAGAQGETACRWVRDVTAGRKLPALKSPHKRSRFGEYHEHSILRRGAFSSCAAQEQTWLANTTGFLPS